MGPTCGDSKVHGDLGARCWGMLQGKADVSARVRALMMVMVMMMMFDF